MACRTLRLSGLVRSIDGKVTHRNRRTEPNSHLAERNARVAYALDQKRLSCLGFGADDNVRLAGDRDRAAAQVASARVRAAGWSVAVIDHRPFGGTCQLRG